MLARMPPTVLLCLFLPDVAQKRRSCDLTVPPALCSLQSFVPVWKLDGVSLHFKCSLPGTPPSSSNLMIPGGGLQENCSSAPPHPPHIPSLSLSYCIGEYNTPILPWPNLHTPFFRFPLFIFSLFLISLSSIRALAFSLPHGRDEHSVVLWCDIDIRSRWCGNLMVSIHYAHGYSQIHTLMHKHPLYTLFI